MTRKGVWNLQQVRDKYLQSLWDNSPQLFLWGTNNYGSLGHNQSPSARSGFSSPVQLSGNWSQFTTSSGTHQTIHAVKDDGTLWGWGRSDSYGNIGDNTNINRSSPTQIPGTTWSDVCSGMYTPLAIKTDGTLWTWGHNTGGILGQNQPEATKISSPVQIPGTTWRTVHPCKKTSFATKTDGTLWAWGSNSYGQLSQNDRTTRSSPVQIPGTTWNSIGAGWNGCLASKTDGTLWSWGYGKHGNLGHGESSFKCYSSPTQIPGTSWNQTAMNFYTSFATRTDGTLWSWGYNQTASSGLLGQNQGGPTVASTSSPKQVPGTTWNRLAIGNRKMIATKTDGTLWGWGCSIYGSLGQNEHGAGVYYSSPTQIGSDTGWDLISSSYFAAQAIKKPLTPSQL